ncbi:MAG: PAS domain-containing protein [Polyangiaceae bacterium]|nr:PAS domain-containing protein [Polyangiaceae bacterium]
METDRLLTDLQTHQIELELQNDELRRKQLQLLQARDELADLYDCAPVGYLTLSHQGTVLGTNLSFARMLGRERGSLVGRLLSDFIHPEDEGASVRDLRRCYRSSNHLTLYHGCNGPKSTGRRPLLSRASGQAELASLASNWRRAVLAEPVAYLRHRYDVYRLAIGLTSHGANLSYGSRFSKRDYPLSPTARSVQASIAPLTSTPLFRVWIYVALAVAAAVAAVPFYRRTGSALPLVFAGSSVSYSLSLFFAAGARDYRYSVWTVLASVLALLAFASTGRLRPAAKSSATVEGGAKTHPPPSPTRSHDPQLGRG